MKKNRKLFNTNFFSFSKFSEVIRVMVLADVVLIGSVGLITPVFAIFISQDIPGASLASIGIAQAIYILSRSLFMLPFAVYIDRVKGERDDFWLMFFGTIIFGLIPLLYLLVDSVLHLYIVQFFYGLSGAMVSPAWNAIWVRHIDKGHEGVENAMYQTLFGLGAAMTATLGAVLAEKYGFEALFITSAIVSTMGTMFLLIIYKDMRKVSFFERLKS